MAKVSVIIPCYNAEKYLDQCLTSVINQTLSDIEIICVDDGSTDNSLNMLSQYAERDARIKVLRQQNKFAGVARNAGMASATGEFVAFLDADDYYEKDGLEKAYDIAKANDLDMLKLSSYLLDEQTGEITTNAHYSHEKFPQKDMVLTFSEYPSHFLNCADVAWNGLYRRSFVEANRIGFNDFRCVNDRSFYINCILSAKRVMVADVFLTYYRRNLTNSLVSNRHKYFECQIGSYNLIKDIASKANIDESAKKMILQHELNQIFIWYDKFLDAGVNVFHVEEVIRGFIAGFDTTDVGTTFLPRFQRKNHFQRIRNSLAIDWKKERSVRAPEITVVVPAHNCVRYLSECIESILLQSFSDFEVICVDDGSTDATAELMDSFAQADQRITVIRQQQSGAGVARNNATVAAKGKYIVYVDSDDKIKVNYLQKLYEAAEVNQADVVVTQRISWFGTSEGHVMRNWIADKRIPQKKAFSCADAPDYILNFTDGAPGGKLFRREFLQKHAIQYLPIRRSEDFYFVFSSFVLAEKLYYLDAPGYYYRKNNVMSLENTKDETPLLFWEATLMLKERLQQIGCYDAIKRSYLNNTINRVAFNLKAVKTFAGFAAVFELLREIYEDELEVFDHEKKYFFDESSYGYILQLLKYETPGECLHTEYKKQMQELAQLRSHRQNTAESSDVKQSLSYRIGSAITFIPRKIRGFIWCSKDHGLGYTVKYGFQKILKRLR